MPARLLRERTSTDDDRVAPMNPIVLGVVTSGVR